MKLLGMALVILGIVALIYGGIGYNRQRTIFELGGLKATATEHKSMALPPIAGALLVIGGAAALMVEKRRVRT